MGGSYLALPPATAAPAKQPRNDSEGDRAVKHHLRRLAVATAVCATLGPSSRALLTAAQGERSLTAVDDKAAKPKPAPRTADGHPDLSGYWKGTRDTKPGGNIGKDLPGFKLPLTPAGAAALQHNLTATIDPERLCIIGGSPQ